MQALGILGYGISLSTLEDVFMKVGHLTNPSAIQDFSSVPELPQIEEDSRSQQQLKGVEAEYSIATSSVDNSFCNNFKAIGSKRFQLLKNWKTFTYECLLPGIIMLIGISMTSIDFFSRSPSRILDPSRVSETVSETLIFDSGINLED